MGWCDNTCESLAFQLRPGSVGSNTASDHISVLTEALAQIPARHRRDVLVTVDGADATRELVSHLTTLNAVPGRRVHYSVGFDFDERACTAVCRVPKTAWQAAWDTDGNPRDLDDAGVAELTGLLREHLRRPAGQLICASSAAGNAPVPGRSCRCSKKPTGGATS